MKHVLIIVAHPHLESLSFAIAETYKEVCEAQGKSVEILDLYREKQQPFLDNSHYTDLRVTPEMEYFQKKIEKAQELVFVFPYWWGGMPAILKNFIDWNFSINFAVEFVDARPNGLLTDKQVKVFTTSGTPAFIYWLSGAHGRLKKMFKKEIAGFCGMKLEAFTLFGSIENGKGEYVLEKIRAWT